MQRFLIFILAILALPCCVFAQDPTTGLPPYGSFDRNGFDTVNLQNLNVNFPLSVVSMRERAGAFSFAVVYDSLVWKNVGSAWTPVTDPSGTPTWGWKKDQVVGSVSYTSAIRYCRILNPPETARHYWNFAYTDSQGTRHSFNIDFYDTPTSCNWPIDPTNGYATDGGGYFMEALLVPSVQVWNSKGIDVTNGGVRKDPNGNFVSKIIVSSTETDWKDTANHTALIVKNVSNTEIDYQYYNTAGTLQTYVLRLQTFSIKTNFACSGVVEYTGSAYLPTELDVPNGQSYTFTYEDTPGFTGYKSGRLKRVTLPTGGYYEYRYPTTGNLGINCSDGTTTNLTRVISSDGTAQAEVNWTFARTGISGQAGTTTMTAPTLPYDSAGNQTVVQFDSNGHETSRFIYQGNSTVLRTINTVWAANGTPATTTTTLEDNQTKNQAETTYDTNGNLLTLKEHDWGTGSPGAVVRTTNYAYLTDSSYVAKHILDRVKQVTVADSTGAVKSRRDIAYDEPGYVNLPCVTGAAQHDDANYSCTFSVRGNPTTTTTYTDAATPSGSILHHSYYDNLGNVVTADLDCCQQEQWSYSATTNYAYPDSVVRGSSPGTQLTSSATYNSYTGLVATTKDENNQVYAYSYDAMKRLTTLQRPDTAQLTWSYNDATPPAQSSVTASVPIQGSSVRKTVTTVDGLGRAVTQQITDGSTTYSIVQTQHDPLGRGYKVSNPYTSTPQYWTTTQFDALGRTTATILPDNAQTSFSYATNTETISDPAGKQRKSQVDGLGRMTSVWEPDPWNGNSLILQTTYGYNILNLPTGVTQGVQSRTYAYDDLGRATSMKAPETNQVAFSYQYNNFGLVTQRTDARGVITTYGYDNLNRLASISYNVGSTGVPTTSSVGFAYDVGGAAAFALGRLTSMSDGVGSETYSYNNLGKMTQLQKVVTGTTYTIGYQYNLAGELTQMTYPSSHVVQSGYDTIGRLSTVSNGTLNYASGFAYNPAFRVTGFNYGNGVAASFGYTPDRQLLQSLAYTKSGSTLFSTNYWYKTDATNCPTGASGNNGQIQCITDNVDSGRTVSYAYDALYRLTSAVTNGSGNYVKWGQSWSYDRYGNALAETQTYDSPAYFSVSVDATTNRITGSPYAYDSNGNMTNDGFNTLVYDAENRMLSASNGAASGSYTYDGNNLRVKKMSGSATTVYIFSGSKVVAEYDNGAAPSSPSREYSYSGGALIAKIDSSGTKYYHQDHLSNRLVTDSSGNTVAQLGHYPFGESWYNATNDKLQFTTYERDAESGNDYAMMRSYVNRLARFPSTDPLPGSISNPQSLNRFAYVRNDPLNSVDPSGMNSTNGCNDDERLPCDSGGGGGSYITCTVDGADTSCYMANAALLSGAAVLCPNNDCGIGSRTPFQCVWSVCGYFSYEYVATHPYEWNGVLYSSSEWTTFLDDRADAQRQALADAISYASNSQDGSNWDYIYNHLDPYDPNGNLQIQGGNVDFRWTGDPGYLSFALAAWGTGGCTLCRYGSMGAIHYNHGLYHLDTASPAWGWGLGLFMHSFVDVLLGNINPSVPIVR